MIQSFVKLLVVSFIGILGDPTYLWRVAVCVGAGVGVTVLTYLLWPGVLPTWPGAVLVGGATALGLVWEWSASRSEENTLK
jgi:hypothetical protein